MVIAGIDFQRKKYFEYTKPLLKKERYQDSTSAWDMHREKKLQDALLLPAFTFCNPLQVKLICSQNHQR